MGLFDKLFGTKKSKKPIFKIELNDSGIFINEIEISFPTSISKLSEILGEPTRQYHEDNDWRIIWDNLGIYTSGGLSNILDLHFLIKPENNLKHLPHDLFEGAILVNRQLPKDIQDQWTKINKYQFGKLRYKGDEKNDIYCYSLMKNYSYKEIKDKDKYEHHKISGEKIEFTDFNFKLAIIEELMYGKELLKPKFDVYEFVELFDKRIIDVDEEGCEPIPEVVDYFKKLEIDKKLAEQITEIYQDGGNEIYMNVAPQWEGEDDMFNIKSYEDLKHFPNLKKMTLFETDPKILEELRLKRIDIEIL
mgnify:CR=1 FL=1